MFRGRCRGWGGRVVSNIAQSFSTIVSTNKIQREVQGVQVQEEGAERKWV